MAVALQSLDTADRVDTAAAVVAMAPYYSHILPRILQPPQLQSSVDKPEREARAALVAAVAVQPPAAAEQVPDMESLLLLGGVCWRGGIRKPVKGIFNTC